MTPSGLICGRNFKKINFRAANGDDFCRNLAGVRFDFRPVAAAQDKHRELPRPQFLLVPQILVGGDKHFETSRFRESEQLAIFLFGPAQRMRPPNVMAG